MALFDMMERLYKDPNSAITAYEKGIVHGMTYMADKLIWGEQYYLDAYEANGGKFTRENWLQRATDMYNIINDTIQNFCSKNSEIRKLWDEDAWKRNEINRKNLGIKETKQC